MGWEMKSSTQCAMSGNPHEFSDSVLFRNNATPHCRLAGVVPLCNDARVVLEAQDAQGSRAEREEPAGVGRQAQPTGGQDAQKMAVGEARGGSM